jgi:hypothetical protein
MKMALVMDAAGTVVVFGLTPWGFFALKKRSAAEPGGMRSNR